MEHQTYLRRKEASTYLRDKFGLKREPSTLAKLAVIGGGPPFRLLNRVPLYTPADLDQWVASRLGPRMHSTSDSPEFAAENGGVTIQSAEPISSRPPTLPASSDNRGGAT
ncbi:MAG TPA: hypothetical protein VFB02_24360 [Bradyrhizobium sp.]|nr:hypothetical protein [Bradyrhizobium sp.]